MRMTVLDLGVGAQTIATSTEIFERFGIRIEIGFDFRECHRLLLKHRPHQPLGAPFDPELHNMSEKNAFWIIGYDSDDRIIHTQAMRLVDLEGKNLAAYMQGRFRDYPPVFADIDLDASRYRPGPGARRITGRTVYHGEIWLSSDAGQKYRGTGLVSVLSRYAFMTCMDRFDPEWVFGFMARGTAYRGVGYRFGFFHHDPSELYWHLMESKEVLEGYLLYTSRDDIRFLLGLPMHDLVNA
jgi:hypothetical protein